MNVQVIDTITRKHWELLHRGGTYANLWARKDGSKISDWWKLGDEPIPAPRNSRHHNYFGVNPCSAIPSTDSDGKPVSPSYVRSRNEYIEAINCVYAEFDDKHFGGEIGAARAYALSLELKPTTMVNSGGGAQCTWVFDVPFLIKTEADRTRAQRLQAAFVKHVGGDQGAKDLSRVLRVPGTLNYKYDPPRPVTYEFANLDRRYTIEEIETLVADELAEVTADAEQPAMLPQAASDADYIRHWCIAALEGEQAKMRAASEGERHNRRYASAFALGGLLHTGGLTQDEIFGALAVNFGTDRKGAEQTIRDGIADGKEKPRDVPTHERPEPTFDALGHACCPVHGERLIPCRNGNGWRCPSPKMGEPLCCWWPGEGYTPPAERIIDGFNMLPPDELREVLRVVIAERDRYREQVEHLETELKQVKEHNRFVTQAHGAPGIATPSKRLTFIELKKELDRVPLEEREPDQFVKVRPSYMAACSNQNRSNISRHLGEFEHAGLIEKKVERTYDPETKSWCSETFVRPLVNLDDPSQVVIASKPRGKQACSACHSEKIERQVRIKCLDCGHEEWSEPELVNPPESELQNANQEETPAEAAITFFEEQPEPVAAVPDGLNCKMQIREQTVVPLFTCAGANQTNEPTEYPPGYVQSMPERLKAAKAARTAVTP